MPSDTKLIPVQAPCRPRYDILAICSVLAVLICILDIAAPMGMASGALYVTVIMFSLLADSSRLTLRMALGLSVFTLIGGAWAITHRPVTPQGQAPEGMWILMVNRAVALIVIWMTAVMGVRLLRVKKQVVDHGAELQRVNVELNKIARHDALTGVANRRHFDERLRQEFLRAMREKAPLSLLMIDVDHFKRYNDRNGHQAGDACLVKVAQMIQNCLRRPADLVARYGGEEFAVILPGAGSSGARERAEAIRKKIEEAKFEPLDAEGIANVTVSVGVAVAQPADIGATPTKLIAAADGALYSCKQGGRNRVGVSATPAEAHLAN